MSISIGNCRIGVFCIGVIYVGCIGIFGSLQAQTGSTQAQMPAMHLNGREYLEYEGVNVMLAHDFYPEGHQGGVGVIQNGLRVATNGDLRLEPTPGQWQPIPKVGPRVVDKATGSISVHMEYPDETKDRKGFNPILYPNLHFSYTIRVTPAGKGFMITVDLDSALPQKWIGKVGFNFELYPGALFGKAWYMDKAFGIFPQQPNGPHYTDADGETQIVPMATGNRLTIAPESDGQRMTIDNLQGNQLQLIDGRGKHNNGWFVVRSLVPEGAVKGAIRWKVMPNAIEGWKSSPVIQVSQVGYHPRQKKIAVIELDTKDSYRGQASLLRVDEKGGYEPVWQAQPREWGDFLRYHYLQFDFSQVQRPGMYVVQYDNYTTPPFQVSDSVYTRNVWQPTLEYFLPVQMCHMRVNDKYRVWHGYCHMDDARMAPADSNHFDGYIQGHSTLTSFLPGQTVPGLNAGAWHDAGDFDLRVESQSETVYGLTLAYEAFDTRYDNTTVDQQRHLVELQQPDGKPDMLEQIEHGLLSIVGGYKSMGRFYRGIIEPTLRQYTTLGDAANITDNKFYSGTNASGAVNSANTSGVTNMPGASNLPDDRWVFTEENPARSLEVSAARAAAHRVMKGYNDTLATACLQIAEEVWSGTKEKDPLQRVELATELYITTGRKVYKDFLLANRIGIAARINRYGWVIGRVLPLINENDFTQTMTTAVRKLRDSVEAQGKRTPYGVPYEPNIWGAGWDIQHFGRNQYFLHRSFPSIFTDEYMLAALNFILGCHPGSNTASFASGVGAHSMIPAYGFNRADWSYIPGGIASGTALIRPDFPELLPFPYLWQQGEYVLGGGTTDYLLLVLGANQALNGQPATPVRYSPSFGSPSFGQRIRAVDTARPSMDTILASMRLAARQGLLDKYYPRDIDMLYGGYLSTFSYDFRPVGNQDKMIVTQARHVWSTAAAALFYHDSSFIPMSRHGFYFLRDKMWDAKYGGFYNLVSRQGVAKSTIKEAYGNAFGIYALSAYYECSGDSAALGLAKRAFGWLEQHSHDPVDKGYFQHLERDGTLVRRTSATDSRAETGYKDQNSSIHLLEALTALYKVWPDPLVRERLQEMWTLIRDRIVTPRGYLQLFFTPAWQPVSYRDSSENVIMAHKNLDHVSFGHDVETAYLLEEAADALGKKDDPATLAIGKKMVDHALSNGWDEQLGGFYDEGYYFKNKPGCTIINRSKNWWAQAEGLNTLLIMAERYPDDPRRYREHFVKLWQYVQTYLVDHVYGDWYEEGLDNEPQRRTALKAHIW
ncbi:MAG TPA: AGE family epimerase/isomerase, partial [Puia sp.]|nr:AGE family epimerase/isomerase [Puia sp.]